MNGRASRTLVVTKTVTKRVLIGHNAGPSTEELTSLFRETHPAHEFLESRIGAQLVEKPNPEMYCPLAVLLDGSLQGFDRCIGVAQGEIDSSQRSWLDVAVIAREQRGGRNDRGDAMRTLWAPGVKLLPVPPCSSFR